MRAVVQIRDLPHYRSDAFCHGLEAAGYQVHRKPTFAWQPEDLLVVWNRKRGPAEVLASAVERASARVVVAENGYIGADIDGRQYYALAVGGHNGSGRWWIGDDDRFSRLNVSLEPFRLTDGQVLVCGQRGIGSATMASPFKWHENAANRLRKLLPGVEIRVRTHPGTRAPTTPLSEDLEGARAVVIWSSSVGVKALGRGIPVYFDAPHWICELAGDRIEQIACRTGVEDLEERRHKALHAMSWGQWSIAELESGLPFRLLPP